ncbi:hypothetical protein M3J09_011597 [Ascochyta lentis]
MFPYNHLPSIDDVGALQRSLNSVSQRADALHEENVALRTQVQQLNGRISYLEAENHRLRSDTIGAPRPPPTDVYATGSDNINSLPAALESLAAMQEHFRSHGTLKRCTTSGCEREAFNQTCFREGHMAWCRTHNRIITRTYTSCSVRSEERGNCLPVYWEDSSNWDEVVAGAFRDGKVGRKGLPTDVLHRLLSLHAHPLSQRVGRPNPPPQARHPYDHWP